MVSERRGFGHRRTGGLEGEMGPRLWLLGYVASSRHMMEKLALLHISMH